MKIDSLEIKQPIYESLLDVRKKNAANLSDEQFANLMKYDPQISKLPSLTDEIMSTSGESYSKWLLKMHKSGALQNHSPEMIKNYLELFNNAKKRKTVLPNNDINAYKSISELEDALKSIGDKLSANQKNKDAKRNQKQLQGEKQPGLYMDGAVELLFNGDNWEVWTPHTFEGSKALRRGAVWCTGGDNDYHYNNYTENGMLYVIINKANPSDKYQLFVPSNDYGNEREFRDKNNNSVKFRQFVHENEELLNFFLTQDIVLNSYDDLEDPDIDDEWDEDREYGIMNEYNLSYDYDDYTICMNIPYNDLLNRSYYTRPSDYEEMATYGYIEGFHKGTYKLLYDIMKTPEFVSYNDWESTLLDDLYKQYISETNNECKFETFLWTLFNTEDGKYSDDKVSKWFEDKSGFKYWDDQVQDVMSPIIAEDLIADFVYSSLKDKGWNPSKFKYKDYGEQFKDAFPYNFSDCHSVEEFYREITDNGRKSYNNIISEFNIEINEEEGDIDISNFDTEHYSDYIQEDAKSIFNLFSSGFTYNDDEDINEVLKVAGVKV